MTDRRQTTPDGTDVPVARPPGAGPRTWLADSAPLARLVNLLIWAAPLAAVIIAGSVVWRSIPAGPRISVTLPSADGVEPRRTVVRYKGVQIGAVAALRLDGDAVVAVLQLDDGMQRFARSGAEFWVVRPEIEASRVSGLDTLVAGPHIAARPAGDAPPTAEVLQFRARASAPLPGTSAADLRVVLTGRAAGTLQRGSPVNFRDQQVGVVSAVNLAPDYAQVEVALSIYARHAALIRSNSRFWRATGLDINFGLFSGMRVDTASMQALLGGAVNVATPDQPDTPAAAATRFVLEDAAPDGHATWRPAIAGPQ